MNRNKTRENRLRRRLAHEGYALRKSRDRSPHVDNLGGYMIVDAGRNFIVAGQRYDLDLDDVEEWLVEA